MNFLRVLQSKAVTDSDAKEGTLMSRKPQKGKEKRAAGRTQQHRPSTEAYRYSLFTYH